MNKLLFLGFIFLLYNYYINISLDLSFEIATKRQLRNMKKGNIKTFLMALYCFQLEITF